MRYLNNRFGSCLGSEVAKDDGRCSARILPHWSAHWSELAQRGFNPRQNHLEFFSEESFSIVDGKRQQSLP